MGSNRPKFTRVSLRYCKPKEMQKSLLFTICINYLCTFAQLFTLNYKMHSYNKVILTLYRNMFFVFLQQQNDITNGQG